MNDTPDASQTPSGYDKRLAIIVPYRDRAEHLNNFIPHMIAYFQRDKLDKNIKHSIHIVEQLGIEKFNRGKINNCGFRIAERESDYFCFHDVDCLPIWADYSYCDRPTHLIWHGLLPRFQYPTIFGGVTAFNKNDFVKTNGFGNDFWGWGCEDTELRERCVLVGLSIGRRTGTFTHLPHENEGIKSDGSYTAEAQVNRKKLRERAAHLDKIYLQDGLSTLEFRLKETSKISANSKVMDNIFHHKVEI